MLKARQPAVTAPSNFLSVVEREGQIARRVAFAAMRQRFGEIGAAIPFRALRRIGLEAGVRIEQRRPEHHRPALVERKGERVFRRRRMHRRQAEQIGLDRQRVGVGHIGVGRVRHRRIEPRAVAADAAMHGIEKILVAVIADAGVLVGRDVGRIHHAERQLERRRRRHRACRRRWCGRPRNPPRAPDRRRARRGWLSPARAGTPVGSVP